MSLVSFHIHKFTCPIFLVTSPSSWSSYADFYLAIPLHNHLTHGYLFVLHRTKMAPTMVSSKFIWSWYGLCLFHLHERVLHLRSQPMGRGGEQWKDARPSTSQRTQPNICTSALELVHKKWFRPSWRNSQLLTILQSLHCLSALSAMTKVWPSLNEFWQNQNAVYLVTLDGSSDCLL